MVSITLNISKELKQLMNQLPWVNWSEIVREEVRVKLKEEKELQHIKKLLKKSTFTEEDAEELANKVKQNMVKNLKEKDLI